MAAYAGTIRLYRPDPAAVRESRRHGRANFSVCSVSATRSHIVVCGEVDALNGRAFGLFVERHTGSSQQLLLDLRTVDFFGTQGFTALYYVSVSCTRRDIDWVLVGGPPVHRMLQICDPGHELPLAKDLGDAHARLDQIGRYHAHVPSAG